MTWLQLVHDIVMVGLIAVGLMVFATLIVRAIGEEQRRNSEHAMKILDKAMDKLTGTIVKTFKEVMQLEKDEQQKRQKDLQDEIDELWK